MCHALLPHDGCWHHGVVSFLLNAEKRERSTSCLHSKVEPSSLESNWISTVLELWMALGLLVMTATGAMESMVNSLTASVSVAEATAAARAWNLQLPPHGKI